MKKFKENKPYGLTSACAYALHVLIFEELLKKKSVFSGLPNIKINK